MLHCIENEHLKIQVNEAGAELWSVFSKKTNTEYLWQGDKKYWGGRAYNLFPFIGRMPEMIYTYNGQTYSTRTHGLARYFTFSLEKQTENSLSFTLQSTEEMKKEYPFAFLFRVQFILNGNALVTRYEVENIDDKEMICAFGGHPGINIPFGEGCFEDFYLDFEKVHTPVRQLLDETNSFMAEKTVEYPLLEGRKLPLKHDLFDNDAVILQNTSGVVSIKSTKDDRYVTMHYEQFPFIGFWHVGHTDAPYVCLEPWGALPGADGNTVALENKPYMTRVGVGQRKDISFSLEIHE